MQLRCFSGLLLLILLSSESVDGQNGDLYPFGDDHSDERVSTEDDVSSSAIHLPRSFPFGSQRYTEAYVSTNGLVSFGSQNTRWQSALFSEDDTSVVTAFWSDIQISGDDGSIFYHLYNDSSSDVIKRAGREITAFTGAHFEPAWVLVATWDQVPKYKYSNAGPERNTFQVVLATNGISSYALYNYPPNGLQWTESTGPYKGVVGYTNSNASAVYNHPLSQTSDIALLASDPSFSNVGIAGRFVACLSPSNGNNTQNCDPPLYCRLSISSVDDRLSTIPCQSFVVPRIASPSAYHQIFPVPNKDAVYSIGQSVYVHRHRKLFINVVTVEGNPTPNLTWTLPDGTRLVPEQTRGSNQVLRNGTLVILHVQDEDGGTYTATAENEYGRDAMSSKVTVVCSPSIVTAMHDESVSQGDRFYTAGASMVMRQGGNLRIDAIVNSSCADVNYTWTLADGSRLRPGEALGQNRVLDNGTLVVARVNVSQSGDWYRVDVSNEGGNDSVVSTLRVICSPRILVVSSPSHRFSAVDESHKTLLVRKSFSFQGDVYTDRHCPVLNFTWTLPNHVQLGSGESSDKFKILTNGTLVINSVDLADQGSYRVEVVSSGGSDSRAFSINVICQPRIIRGRGTTSDLPDSNRHFAIGQKWTIRVGNDLYADVIINQSCPRANITWQLANRSRVAPRQFVNGAYVLANGTLVLKNVQLIDAGTYTATAFSLGGRDSVSSVLDVVCRPKIIRGVGSVSAIPNDNVYSIVGRDWILRKGFSLLAAVFVNSSCPTVNISWRLPNGGRMETGEYSGRMSVLSDGSLLIFDSELGDSGEYEAEARTIGGSDFAISFLRIICTPKILPSSKATSDLTFSNRYYEIGQRWIIRTGFRLYGNVVVDRECPNVNVSWRPPGGIFLNEGQSDGRYKVLSNGTLVIENTSLSDTGRYKVRVSTEGGVDQSSSELTVICLPDILSSSGSLPGLPFADRFFSAGQQAVVRKGYGVRVGVRVNPKCPNVTLSWILSTGVSIGAGQTYQKFTVFSNGTLYIRNATLSDAGEYLVAATNQGGKDNATSHLVVICQPKILPSTGAPLGLPDSNRYFGVGQQWIIRDGYTLQANVDIDSACPHANITWHLENGNRLQSGDNRGRYSVLSNGTLVIERASLGDAGAYVAYARAAGGVDSATSLLTVICRPQIIPGSGFLSGLPNADRRFVLGETTWNIRLGYTAYVDVVINQSCPVVNITWHLANGTVLDTNQSDGRFRVLPNGTLVISRVHLSDQGIYRATARTDGGASSAESPLSVRCRPKISVPPSLSSVVPNADRNLSIGLRWTIRRGRSLVASVQVDTSCPNVDVSWFVSRGLLLLKAGNRSRNYRVQMDGSLKITDAQVYNEGTFVARVVSSGGEDAAFSRLSVIFPPLFVVSPPATEKLSDPIPDVGELTTAIGQRIRCRPGQTIVIVAEIAEARPAADIEWTLPNGTILKANSKRGRFEVNANGTRLVITSIQETDQGPYTARAANGIGFDEKTSKVVVIPQPMFDEGRLSQTSLVVDAGRTISLRAELKHVRFNLTVLEWTLPDGRSLLQGQVLGKFVAANNSLLNISKIWPEDAGSYLVTATNPAGKATKKFRVRVKDYVYELRHAACNAACGPSGVQDISAFCLSNETQTETDESKCIVAEKRRPAVPPPLPCNRRPCEIYVWETNAWDRTSCISCVVHQNRRVTCLFKNEGTNASESVSDINCAGYSKPRNRRLCNEGQCSVIPRFRQPPAFVMPLNRSLVYNRYDVRQQVIGVQGRYLYIDTVLAQGSSSSLAISWTFPNNTYVHAGQSRGRFTVFGNGTLHVKGVQFADRGQYEVTAENSVGRDHVALNITIYVPSQVLSRNVYRSYRPRLVDSHSGTIKVQIGESVVIFCRHEGFPKPSLTWTRNGDLVAPDNRIRIQNNGVLVISKILLSDSGTYECTATNVVGADSKNVTLTAQSFEVKWVRVARPCSVTCGRGERVIAVECRTKLTRAKVADFQCQELVRPPANVEVCYTTSCPPRWRAADFGNCTESCIETRRVWCGKINKRGGTVRVSSYHCKAVGKKPPKTRRCSDSGQWVVSDWSKCSNSCGRRNVTCVDTCGEWRGASCQRSGPKPPVFKPCGDATCIN